MLTWPKPYQPLNQVSLDLDAIRSNLNLFREKLPSLAVAPVLKSNAYGHGLKEIAKALKREGCPFFVVDSIYEAYKIREVDSKTPLLILGYNSESNLRKKKDFHFTAGSVEQLEMLAHKKLPIHLELNTGMNRMGFHWRNPEIWLKEVAKHKKHIVGIFTHFADADNPDDNSFTDLQVQRFKFLKQELENRGVHPEWIHAANSAGSLKVQDPIFNMMRLGFSLYGINVYEESDPFYRELEGLKPVMEFQSTLVQIQELEPGDAVSYGLQFKANKPTRIGILCAGYYEGIPIALSNVGHVEVNGQLCPIRGRVCMNHTLVELGEVKAKIGDRVTVYSKDPHSPVSVRAQAKKAKTIPYELLVRISESVRRLSSAAR